MFSSMLGLCLCLVGLVARAQNRDVRTVDTYVYGCRSAGFFLHTWTDSGSKANKICGCGLIQILFHDESVSFNNC